MKDRYGSHLVHTVGSLRPEQQLFLFQTLGQLQRELGMHVLGTRARKRIEAEQTVITNLIMDLVAKRKKG
jgi:hypothetical protein